VALFVSALNAMHMGMLSCVGNASVIFIVGHCPHTGSGYMWERVGKKFASPADSAENIQRPREEKENTNSGTSSVFDVASVKRGEIREVLLGNPVSVERPPELEGVRSLVRPLPDFFPSLPESTS